MKAPFSGTEAGVQLSSEPLGLSGPSPGLTTSSLCMLRRALGKVHGRARWGQARAGPGPHPTWAVLVTGESPVLSHAGLVSFCVLPFAQLTRS